MLVGWHECHPVCKKYCVNYAWMFTFDGSPNVEWLWKNCQVKQQLECMWRVFDVQTDFLNSVIVDLQRKNESLQLQLEAALSLHNKLTDDDEDVILKYVSYMSLTLVANLLLLLLSWRARQALPIWEGQRCPEEMRNSTRLWIGKDPSLPRDSWQPFIDWGTTRGRLSLPTADVLSTISNDRCGRMSTNCQAAVGSPTL